MISIALLLEILWYALIPWYVLSHLHMYSFTSPVPRINCWSLESAFDIARKAGSLKRKCHHFDLIFITGCTGSCQNDNFQCSQRWKFRQNHEISVSVFMQNCVRFYEGTLLGSDVLIHEPAFLVMIRTLSTMRPGIWSMNRTSEEYMPIMTIVKHSILMIYHGSFWVWFSQYETMLHCNVVSHWLSPYPEWSLETQISS